MSAILSSDAIVDFLKVSWTATPVAYENEPFTKPLDAQSNVLPWVAVEITENSYAQESIGAQHQADNQWDADGQLWLHVFVAEGSGSSEARRIAKALADLFRGLTLIDGSLEFLGASIGRGQPGQENGNYWGVSVSIDWRRIDA